MNIILSNSVVLICALALVLVNMWLAVRLNFSNNLNDIKLYWILVVGVITLIAGFSVQLFNMATIYEEVAADSSSQEEIASEIKASFMYSVYFICLFGLSIIAWTGMKVYRQKLYNDSNPLDQ